MRKIRLYTPQALKPNITIELNEATSIRLTRVLRIRVGDSVTLFNGDGFDWNTTVTKTRNTLVTVAIGSSEQLNNESPIKIHLGLCLSKGERFDWAVQKVTEMGITEVTPLFSERVDVKLPANRVTKRIAHWQKIVIGACEQCGRAMVPTINEPRSLIDWTDFVTADLKLLMHHRQIRSQLTDTPPQTLAFLVGPEGGLTDTEILHAHKANFQSFRLGPRIMRTETAPIAMLAVIGAHWGDLR